MKIGWVALFRSSLHCVLVHLKSCWYLNWVWNGSQWLSCLSHHLDRLLRKKLQQSLSLLTSHSSRSDNVWNCSLNSVSSITAWDWQLSMFAVLGRAYEYARCHQPTLWQPAPTWPTLWRIYCGSSRRQQNITDIVVVVAVTYLSRSHFSFMFQSPSGPIMWCDVLCLVFLWKIDIVVVNTIKLFW